LRVDHLRCFGYPRLTAPFLEELAGDSVFFHHARTGSSTTNPAHACMFTGLHMPQHGVLYNGQASCDESLHTMAELFRDAGYDTAAFCSVPWMKLLRQGFGHFDTRPRSGRYSEANKTDVPYYQANEVVDHALAWLGGKAAGDRLFLWLHLYDPHDPYHPPPDCLEAMRSEETESADAMASYWAEAQGKGAGAWPWQGDEAAFADAQDRYDAEVRFVDQELKRFHQTVQTRGLAAGSLWVVTSDHGEGLGSHGYFGHGERLHEEQLRALLLFHTPEGPLRPRRVEAPVHHVDLLPTVAALLGQRLPEQPRTLQGLSLLPVLAGEGAVPQRLLYSQRRIKLDNEKFAHWEEDPVCCLTDGRHKLVHHHDGPDEFYDLAHDPRETRNLIEEGGAIQDRMEAHLRATYAQLAQEGGGLADPGADEALTEDLRALGYL